MKLSSNCRCSRFLVVNLLLHCALYSTATQSTCLTYYTQSSVEEVLSIKIEKLRKAKPEKKSLIELLSKWIKGIDSYNSVRSEVSLKELETILNGNLQYEIDGVTIYYTFKDPYVNPPIAEKTEHFKFFLGENLKLAEFLDGIYKQNGKIRKIEIFDVSKNTVTGSFDGKNVYRRNHLIQSYEADRNGVKQKIPNKRTASPKYLQWFNKLPPITVAEVLSKSSGKPLSVAARVASSELSHANEYVEGIISDIYGQLQLIPTIGAPISLGKNNPVLELKFKSDKPNEVERFGTERFAAIVEMFALNHWQGGVRYTTDSYPDYLVTIPKEPSQESVGILKSDLAEGVLDNKLVLLKLRSTRYFSTGLVEVGESLFPTPTGDNLKPSIVKIDQITEDEIVLKTESGTISIPWYEIESVSIAGRATSKWGKAKWGKAKHSFLY